jgi:hypothetical protein
LPAALLAPAELSTAPPADRWSRSSRLTLKLVGSLAAWLAIAQLVLLS